MISRWKRLLDRDRAGAGRRETDAAFEAKLRAHFRDRGAEADTERAAARVLARLSMRPLPPQRRSRFAGLWPSALLTGDFGLAWPRVAALAAVAALGFALGSMDFARMQDRDAAAPLGYSAVDSEFGGILFDDDV